MMEAVTNWLDRTVQSSLDVPHPAELDGQRPSAGLKTPGSQHVNDRNIVPFRILIKTLQVLPSSLSSVGASMLVDSLSECIHLLL